jgi:hypothetical protein
MAPLQRDWLPPALQVPSMDLPFYSSTTLSSSTSDLNSAAALSPRTLYAQSFDRPTSSSSLPPGRFRKNMKDITGFTTTEDEFDALPIAVRRKVCHNNFSFTVLRKLLYLVQASTSQHVRQKERNIKPSNTNCRVPSPIL